MLCTLSYWITNEEQPDDGCSSFALKDENTEVGMKKEKNVVVKDLYG